MLYLLSAQYNGPCPTGGESKSLVYKRPEGTKVTVSFNHCEVLFPFRFDLHDAGQYQQPRLIKKRRGVVEIPYHWIGWGHQPVLTYEISQRRCHFILPRFRVDLSDQGRTAL